MITHPPSRPPPEHPSGTSRDHQPRRVLVIDAEAPTFGELVRRINALFAPAVQVEHVGDGRQGLDLLSGPTPYHLLLTELKLRGADGLEVIQQALARRPAPEVFVLSDFPILDDLREVFAHQPGMHLYRNPDEAVAALGEILACLRRQVPRRSEPGAGAREFVDALRGCHEQRKDCCVEFTSHGITGYLCFQAGELFHASFGMLRGEQAIRQMVATPRCEFRISEGTHQAEANVTTPVATLLSTPPDARVHPPSADAAAPVRPVPVTLPSL